ncbi:hypothetical protein B808_1028 [Fructilactobacillus florum 8D]|uniref:Uncharacterized protein n=1 Tax=Fructilactobacillus florum 8D TaxID=1221538 RepID=W9EGG4_9LACO|nr:hypothetical protein [Fructilactobacillus florum]EKK20080.1 hypothetical protein B807_1152 [Fructilactobacillus florum 2F]ETO40080.1 hypothetical protein B808_1028 [Fructilactobacillus florum 8D]
MSAFINFLFNLLRIILLAIGVFFMIVFSFLAWLWYKIFHEQRTQPFGGKNTTSEGRRRVN